MTRWALLSDVHANLQALDACLAHAREQGATAFAFLGDHVGYGGQPADVVACVQSFAANGAIVLRGNHDVPASAAAAGPTMADAAAAGTQARLDGAARAWLAALPLEACVEGALLVHASAQDPEAWVYVDSPLRAQLCMDAAAAQAAAVRRVFCGHVHHQRLFYQGRRGGWMPFDPVPGAAIPLAAHRRWVATVGSVGQPRDGDPRAMYALWDAGAGALTFHRVGYDHAAAAAAVRAAGLPDAFARRLEDGR